MSKSDRYRSRYGRKKFAPRATFFYDRDNASPAMLIARTVAELDVCFVSPARCGWHSDKDVTKPLTDKDVWQWGKKDQRWLYRGDGTPKFFLNLGSMAVTWSFKYSTILIVLVLGFTT